MKLIIYWLMSDNVESRNPPPIAPKGMFAFGLRRPESKAIVIKLSCLFVIDAFAGGFVLQPYIVYWFAVRYGMKMHLLGTLLMGMNLLAGFSALVSGRCVKAFGAINTMVFTHFPSNVFLMLVALMPNCEWAVIMLLISFAISQMDVPAREAYVNNVVESDEKPAANGITMLVRGVGVACAPVIVGYLSENPNSVAFTLPFIISGALKCCYDVILYIVFQMTPPKAAPPATSSTGAGKPDPAAPSVSSARC